MRKTTLLLLSLLIVVSPALAVKTSMTEVVDADCTHTKKKLNDYSHIQCDGAGSSVYIKSWNDPVNGTRSYQIGTDWDDRTINPNEGTSTSIFSSSSGSLPQCPGGSVASLASHCITSGDDTDCPGTSFMTYISVEETSFNHFNCYGMCSNGNTVRWEACTLAQPNDPPPTYPPCESPCPLPPICPPPPICCGPGCP